MNSIISFPKRGPYGNPSWRGNTSGYVVKALLKYFMPNLFVDPAEGSGTSKDVAREMGIEYVGLDLHSGFNLLKDRILERLPREADYLFFHPPYHDIIKYSGEQWGDKPHPDDLSRAESKEDFLDKLQIALFNIYEATKNGGFYTVQIGDIRKQGQYWSVQSDIIQMAPGILDGVVIKAQHNCMSDNIRYSGNFIPIMHEYILNFKKERLVFGVLDTVVSTSQKLVSLSNSTWKAVVHWALKELGGRASLPELYEAVSKNATKKTKQNPNWQAKIRQVLQQTGQSAERGVWEFKAA